MKREDAWAILNMARDLLAGLDEDEPKRPRA
jgi:hypothetical protein